MGRSEMTELDSTVLAVIALEGPLSAYDVRARFERSLTREWSSSTGSIYPSIRRLHAGGYIWSSAPEGPRGKQKLTSTERGRADVAKWVCSLSIDLAAAHPDPLRTRAQFLKLLDEDGQRRFIREAKHFTSEALEKAERRAQERIANGLGRLEALAEAGALYELRARREWLRLLERETV
jgi:DNA-binding PadR family transcriptional regulator